MATSDPAEELLALGAATIGESGGRPCAPVLRPIWQGARLAGRALTVRCAPGDNLAIHVAVARATAGSVLVVNVEAEPERGYWGEILSTAAQARGVTGLVIDAGVRDVTALERRRFPVFATMTALPGATKHGGGEVGAPVVLAGVEVHTGDWIVGDADGVAVVAADELVAVLAAGHARVAREADIVSQLDAGATTLELLHLDEHTVDCHPSVPAAPSGTSRKSLVRLAGQRRR